MTREEELMQIKKERDEMKKHMTDMFDLAFMLNNRNDIMSPQAHYEKLARMVTHYMGSIQQSYGYMADKVIELLEQEPKTDILDKIRAEISRIWHTHPKNRYEEGLKDQALKDMKIIDKYRAESEG